MLRTKVKRYMLWLIFIAACGVGLSTSTTTYSTTIGTVNIGYRYEKDIPDDDRDARSQYAAQMLSFMDRSVEPCDDFYEYACGNWKNVIRARNSPKKRNYLTDIAYTLTDIAGVILQRSDIIDVAPEYDEEFQLTKKFYHNCLQTDLRTTRKSLEYLEIIQMIGGFPALDPQWDASNFSWVNMSAHMSNYGINGLMSEGINPEYPFNPYFAFPVFGFDIELHPDSIENSSSNAYQTNNKRMRDILSLYDVAEDKIDSVVGGIIYFLKDVFKIFQEFDENEYKCKSLSNSTNEVISEAINQTVTEQWRAYYGISWMGKKIHLEGPFAPCAYLYYKFDTLCEEHKEAVANYLSLKFLYDMDAKLEDVAFQTDYCISKLRDVMTYLFDHLYMKIYTNYQAFDEVKAMIDDIKKSLRTIIEEADWLDYETREAALLKESAMGIHIGRYEDPEMIKRLVAELKNLQFVEDNYEANNLNLNKFKQFMTRYNGLHIDDLNNSTKPLQLLVGMQANAFYYNIDNSIYVMAGVLQPPMFQKTWPNSLKYGTLGFLVGHELTHAFDAVGSKYDHDGIKHSWWSDESGNMFKERGKCFVEYFDKYFIPEINRNINGNKTSDENIADAGGLRVALLAYRRFIENASTLISQDDERMPDLDLSPEKLFFLGSAQVWCSSYEEAHYWEELSDEHTIDKYRVLGMFSNNEEFGKVYNCPLGSAMNPAADKCVIW